MDQSANELSPVTLDSVSVNPLLDLTAGVVSAYLGNPNNRADISNVTDLMTTVHFTLKALNDGTSSAAPDAPVVDAKSPAEIKKSISKDALTSFIDGKKYKTLKRHLSGHGLTPETYRERFGLPADYPMVAASYSEQRSSLAKAGGLGKRPGAATEAAAA